MDEDDDGVDMHVVQPLDGMGGDIQETVPVLKGVCGQSGPGDGPKDTGALPRMGPPPANIALPPCINEHMRTSLA